MVCFLLHEQSDEAAIPPAGSVSVLSESQSRVLCELEFTRLNERLAEALESEVNLHLL